MAKRKAKENTVEDQAVIDELDELLLEFDNLVKKENTMANKLGKLAKVNESITINRYDNGWMVEVGGRDSDSDWKNCKILCNTEEEMLAVIQEWNSMEIDS